MTTFLGSPGIGNIRGEESFPKAAKRALQDTQMRRNVGAATKTIREKRLGAVAECDDWEELRLAGSALKTDVMSRLPELLQQLEANVTARGGVVHWARDADEANRIITDLVKATSSDEVVKVKSMATQETGLNEYLEAEGIAAIETDLAELIVQLGDDKPSHILVPAIHRNRAEIREIFLRRMPGVDLAQLRGDAFVGPAFEGAAQVDANEFAEHASIDLFEVVEGQLRGYRRNRFGHDRHRDTPPVNGLEGATCPTSCSVSWRSGKEACAPGRVTAMAAAALAQARASRIGRPSAMAAASPPLKASPAATVSVAWTGYAGQNSSAWPSVQ